MNSSVRIEKLTTRSNDAACETYKLVDFVKFRDTHGPGKASRIHALSDIDFAPDEYFGEETAALYVPETRWFLVQYNHYGVRSSAMAAYFSRLLCRSMR